MEKKTHFSVHPGHFGPKIISDNLFNFWWYSVLCTIIKLLLLATNWMSHSLPCWEHVFSYCCNLMLCGVNITTAFAYIRWLMTVFPKTQPVLHLLATLVNVKPNLGTRSPLQLPNSTAHSKIKATTEIPQQLLRTVGKLFRSKNSNLSIKYENIHEFWLP